MPDFANPKETWNARFAREDYLFGRTPNTFLASQAHLFVAGQRALCVADGEGRNSVWLAELGLDVTAFDLAPNAVRKARALAAERGVSAAFWEGDILDYCWPSAAYDVLVAVFIQFLSPRERPRVFQAMRDAVRPGGLFLLEGYRPEQVAYATGGPGKVEHMYTREWLEIEFAAWDILHLAAYDTDLGEGSAHRGRSAVIDLVARKRTVIDRCRSPFALVRNRAAAKNGGLAKVPA
jgi:SAM-dependent methyltransferase